MGQAAISTSTNYLSMLTFWGYSLKPTGTGYGGISYDGSTLTFSDTFQYTHVNEATRGFTDAIYANGPVVTGNGQEAVEARLANLATSMTNTLRSSANRPAFADGIAATWETYITVNFLWMIPPVVLDLATIVLLICTIIVTRRSKVPAWKSSQLAVLFAANDDPEDKCQLVADVDLLEKEARAQYVRLSKVPPLEANRDFTGGTWQMEFETRAGRGG